MRATASNDDREFDPPEDDGEFETPPADDDMVVDKRRLAALTGYTLPQLDRYVKEGLPAVPGPRGRGTALKFRMPDAIQWLVNRRESSIEDARRRSLEAVARKREVETARLENRYVDVDAIAARIESNVAHWRSRLLAIPARLRADIRHEVTPEIEAAINELAIELPKDDVS